MSLNAKQLGKVIKEIKAELTGGIVRRIDQPHPRVILFEIEHLGIHYHLLFSGHPHYSRCHLTQEKYSTPKIQMPFCQLLRAHLRYKTIHTIKQLPGNRIIQLECAWSKNNMKSVTFVAELIGSASNFFLTDTKGCILGMLSHPHPSRPITRRCLYHAHLTVEEPDFKGPSIPLMEHTSFTFNRSIDRFYFELEKKDKAAAAKKSLIIRFNHTIKRLGSRLIRLASRLSEAEKSLPYQSYGELLKCHLHEIGPEMDQFKYPGPISILKDEKERMLLLDPALSPTKNMEWFFVEYKKGLLARSTLIQEIEKTKKILIQLEKGRDAICHDKPVEITDFPLISIKKGRGGNKRKRTPMTYLSSDNIFFFVGRNALEDETITFRLAHGNDLWFHARGVPGSHLIVRMDKRKEIPNQTLLEAATLAIYFSPFKKAGRGEVMYARKRHVQRGRKGKRGSIRCSQEQGIYIEIDPSHLSNILKNRIDHERRD